MRPLFFILLSLFALPTFAAEHAFAWEGKGADGKTIHFDPAHRTKPAILLFWATWCPYCEAQMPTLQAIYDQAGKDRLDVYAIDIKEDGDPIKTLKERHQTFTLILDGDSIAEQYRVKGTPGLFLVDEHGDIVYHADTSDPAKVGAALRERLKLPAR
jgi:cytochrome c biogenesis protein CcmG/thiol:disulfide interchange protein DsbE